MGNIVLLSTLVNMEEPRKVYEEIEFLISSISPTIKLDKIQKAFEDLINLFS